MNILKAFKNDRLMKSLTWLSIKEFNDLLPSFEKLYIELANKKERKRKYWWWRKGELKTIEHKLFFILFYLKIYPTYDLGWFIFWWVDRSKVCLWVKRLLPILRDVLWRELVLPQRKITSVDEFIRNFPNVKDLFLDWTERRIQRPNKPKNQKKNYSWKKKTHTRKNTIWSDKDKRIILVSPTKNWRCHDKKQFDKNWGLENIPDDVWKWTDTWFQWIDKIYKNVFIPKKRSKNNILSKEDIENNKIISSFRIVVEHAIWWIKRFNCLSNLYRNKKWMDDMLIITCAGLWNYHLRSS